MNDDCRWSEENLTACLDEELTAAERTRLEAHASACPACAAERLAFEGSWSLFKDAHPPEALPARLRRNPFERRRLNPALALGLAAAAVLLFVRRPAPPPAPPPPALAAKPAPLPPRKASGLPVPPVPGLAKPPRPAPVARGGASGLAAAPFAGVGGSGLDAAPFLPEKRSDLAERRLRFAVVVAAHAGRES